MKESVLSSVDSSQYERIIYNIITILDSTQIDQLGQYFWSIHNSDNGELLTVLDQITLENKLFKL